MGNVKDNFIIFDGIHHNALPIDADGLAQATAFATPPTYSRKVTWFYFIVGLPHRCEAT